MSNSNFKLGSNAPTVSWADPRNYQSSANSQVIYYIIKFYEYIPLRFWRKKLCV